MLYQVIANHFTAGLVAEDAVVRSAPICHYMVGWTIKRVASYCRQKRWTLWVDAGVEWRMVS